MFCSVAEKRLLVCNAKSQEDTACHVLRYEVLTCSNFQFPEKLQCLLPWYHLLPVLLLWHNYLWIKRHQQKQTTYFNFSWIISMIVLNTALLKVIFNLNNFSAPTFCVTLQTIVSEQTRLWGWGRCGWIGLHREVGV